MSILIKRLISEALDFLSAFDKGLFVKYSFIINVFFKGNIKEFFLFSGDILSDRKILMTFQTVLGKIMKKIFLIMAVSLTALISNVQAQETNSLTPEEKELGFELLFDGGPLDNSIWQGSIEGYPVKDGYFVCEKGGQLLTKKEYDNFVFRFEFKLPPKGNNGVGIRTPLGKDSAYYGMEIQILNDDYPGAADWQKHGSIYGVVPAKTGALNPTGEWNEETIIANGSNIQVIVNGQTIVNVDITDVKPIHNAEHPGLHNKTGFIGFLGHGDPVEFRNVRILKIKNDDILTKIPEYQK